MRKLVLALAAAAALAAVAVARAPETRAFVPTADADPSDGAALVREAVANLHDAGRFRFTHDASGGTASGEADLSGKLHTTTRLASGTVLDEIVVDGDVYTRLPGQRAYTRTGRRDARDPATALLDGAAALPGDAFGAPARTGDGGWSVAIEPMSLVVAIDAQHLVREIRYERDGASVAFGLSGYGDPSIDVRRPS